MQAAQDCGGPRETGSIQSLWRGADRNGISVSVIGQARTAEAAIELHDVVFHADAESDQRTDTALFDLSLSRRGGEPVGHYPDFPQQPQRRIGDLLFIPPQTRFRGRWRRCTQRTLWLIPHDTERWLEREWPADVLQGALDIRSGELRGAMLRLAGELARPGFAADLMLEALSTQVLILLQRHLQVGPARGSAGADEAAGALSPRQLRRIEDICDAPGPVPTLAELARDCGISERHFSRLFRLATGHSAARFVLERRMERARDRLGGSRAPIKQIAWEAGFESPAAFATAFRRATGQSPRAFRQVAQN